MAILSPEQTAALLSEAGAVVAHPRLPMGLIVWKDDQGRPVASARCQAILHSTTQALIWSAGDPAMTEQGVPTVPIPHGLPPRQPGLPEAAARGMAQLALAGSDAELILPVEHGDGLLFLAIHGFAQGPPLSAKTPTEEVPRSLIAALEIEDVPTPPPESEEVPGSEQPAEQAISVDGLLDVRVAMGPKQQIVTISLEASDGWMDTGLDPVQLATRPVLLGFDIRMLWVVDGDPSAAPVPHLAFRHVADPAGKARPPFRYAASPMDPPVPESGDIQPLGPTNRLRFPSTPGRIEVKIIHLDCDRPVRGFQGYLRIMAMMQKAGQRDIPHKHAIDHIHVAPWEPGFDTPERLPNPAGAPSVSLPEED